jgi:N-acyl-D-amino-acid deacylase
MPAYKADIACAGTRSRKIGRIPETAAKEIDAEGRIVAPGFIDPHTHFDAQLFWDGFAKPALSHGVTTIVPGNCSLSLAPLKAEHRMKLVGMFNQIEEMPLKAFEEGVVWDWETFSEYITRIRKGLAINVAPLVGHSVLRLWVMGDAAMERTATDAEIAEMQSVLRECLDAGAIGLSTSYVDMDEKLQPVPSRHADAGEVDALASVLGEYGRVLQIVPEFYDPDLTIARLDQLAELSLKYGIPTTFSPALRECRQYGCRRQGHPPGRRTVRARWRTRLAAGTERPIDISFCFAVPSLLFIRLPSWYGVMRFGTHDQIIAAFRDEETRKKLVAEAAQQGQLWPLLRLRHVNTPDNQKYVGKTLAEIAEMRGTTPIDAMIDLSLEEDLDAHFIAASMGHNSDEKVSSMLKHPRVHIGASDGGAHILSFSTYGDTGYLFGHFVRNLKAMSIEEAVKKVTHDTAAIWGIPDRGSFRRATLPISLFSILTPSTGEKKSMFRTCRATVAVMCGNPTASKPLS